MAIQTLPRGAEFNSVEVDIADLNGFDMSFENKLTAKFGVLTPTLLQECIPGDVIDINSTSFVRFQPMLSPLMHKVDVKVTNWFVPFHIIWDDSEEFFSPGNGNKTMVQLADDYQSPLIPKVSLKDVPQNFKQISTLMDYLGCQAKLSSDKRTFDFNSDIDINVLPFRAYQCIYDNFYRDQNVTEGINMSTASGVIDSDEVMKIMQLRKSCWEHDYFTSALPLPQRGKEVYLPLGTSAPVKLKDRTYPDAVYDTSNHNNAADIDFDSNGHLLADIDWGRPGLGNLGIDNSSNLYADLSSATSITINALRLMTSLQKFLEKASRTGGRYIERIKGSFPTDITDERLSRPEYLGGQRIPVQISAVTSSSGYETPDSYAIQGTQTGQAVAGDSNHISYKVQEHGYFIQIVTVMPRTAYSQGIKRTFLRDNYLDFAWPEFGHLGEQEVFNAEIYGSSNDPLGTFGYQPRYAEYKYNADETHGDFLSSMSYWTMSRSFSAEPRLNTSFLEVDTQTCLKPFAVTASTYDPIYMDIWHEFKMLRPLPLYSTPTL